MQLDPYLTFNGNCQEAFKFYEQCLEGKIELMLTHEDSPMAGKTPPEWRNAILHARLVVGDRVLLGSDRPPQDRKQIEGFSISINVGTTAEAERLFHAPAEGGKIEMPLQETFWASRFGMLADRFGVPWMINCELPPQKG